MIAFRAHADFPLVIAANRDEFHSRPTRDAQWWADDGNILGGRDLQAGGTWLALNRNGRFGAVSNFRDAEPPSAKLKSRGHLITEFLQSTSAPLDFAASIDDAAYGGFNLLVGDGRQLAYRSNRGGGCRELSSGLYGVSNATLDTPWPKVERSRASLHVLLAEGSINETALFRMLDDRTKANVRQVHTGGLPFDKAHALTAAFIVLPDYGTRSSTVIIRDRHGSVHMCEKRFAPNGAPAGQSDFGFKLTG